ncbi:MAG: peptidase [Verrucomicrobiales bacterium]|nr:peptidase [Verrucomicrobiales bacterium]
MIRTTSATAGLRFILRILKGAILNNAARNHEKKSRGNIVPYEFNVSFDGKIYSTFQSNDVSGDITSFFNQYSVRNLTNESRVWAGCSFPYLNAAGFYTPDMFPDMQSLVSVEPWVVHHLRKSKSTTIEKMGDDLRITMVVPDEYVLLLKNYDFSKQMYILDSPTSPNAEGLRTRLRVRELTPERKVSLLLDAKHGFAAAERDEWAADGHLLFHTISDGWKYFGDKGIWLPGHCVTLFYGSIYDFDQYSSQPIRTNMCDLTDIQFGHRDVQFSPESTFAPGTLVTDHIAPEAGDNRDGKVMYMAGPNGEKLGMSPKPTPAHRSSSVVFGIVLSLLGITALVVLSRIVRSTMQ